jgi:hypothetical protein
MMHVIGRKPVHFLDLDLKVLDRPALNLLEPESFGAVGALIPHRPD